MKKCYDKNCTHGGRPQPLENFSFDKRNKDGLKIWCRSCISRKQAERYQRIKDNDPEKHEKIIKQSLNYYHRVRPDLKRSYGLTLDQYQSMLDKQQNCCEICKVNFNTLNKNPSVDHSHLTGKVRDLLCNHCSTILGLCKENVSILESTVQYIKKHSS